LNASLKLLHAAVKQNHAPASGGTCPGKCYKKKKSNEKGALLLLLHFWKDILDGFNAGVEGSLRQAMKNIQTHSLMAACMLKRSFWSKLENA